MFVEKQERYPKGTYKVLITLHMGTPTTVSGFHLVNLATGYQVRSSALWDLVQAIEDDILASKYPQSTMKYRTWGAGPTPLAKRQPASAGRYADPQTARQLAFIVKVLFRQNATWQGTVQWLEGRQTRQYRSVNELLRLMGEAVEITQAGAPDSLDGNQKQDF